MLLSGTKSLIWLRRCTNTKETPLSQILDGAPLSLKDVQKVDQRYDCGRDIRSNFLDTFLLT